MTKGTNLLVEHFDELAIVANLQLPICSRILFQSCSWTPYW